MTEYRLYTVENDGHFTGSRTFTAASDDDAVVWAKQQIEDHSVELWSDTRLVTRLDPPEKRAAVTHTIEAGRMVPKNKNIGQLFNSAASRDRGAHWLSSVMGSQSRSRQLRRGWSSTCQSIALSDKLPP
jgi:hypothetical protein